MISKRIYLLAIATLVGVAAFLTHSAAQTAPPTPATTKIAFCDLVAVFNDYQRAKDLTAKLKDARDATEAERQQREKRIEALRRELESYKRGSQQYERTVNELTRQGIELEAYMRFQEQLALREHRALTEEMYKEILGAVGRVAKANGVAIVMQREQEQLETRDTNAMLQQIYNRKVLYFAESLDITEAVLKLLNRDYKPAGAAAGGGPIVPPTVR